MTDLKLEKDTNQGNAEAQWKLANWSKWELNMIQQDNLEEDRT